MPNNEFNKPPVVNSETVKRGARVTFLNSAGSRTAWGVVQDESPTWEVHRTSVTSGVMTSVGVHVMVNGPEFTGLVSVTNITAVEPPTD